MIKGSLSLKIIFGIILVLFLFTSILIVVLFESEIEEQNRKLRDTSWMQERIKEGNTLESPKLDNSWRLYQNPFGYQISYPVNWGILENSPQNGLQITRLVSSRAYAEKEYDKEQGKALDYDRYSPVIHIFVFDSLDGLKEHLVGDATISPGFTVEEVAQNLKRVESKTHDIYTSSVPIFIGSLRVFALTKADIEKKDVSKVVVLTEGSGFYYEFEFNNTNAITQLTEEERNVLASFRLTEPSEKEIKPKPPVAKNWQDYENKKLGFKLKVPDDWIMTPKNKTVEFISPEEIKEEQWCEFRFCESPHSEFRFSITKYDNFKEFKKIEEYGGKANNIESYLKERKSDRLSYKRTKVNKYPAFGLEITYGLESVGIYTDYAFLIPRQEKIYEIYFNLSKNKEGLSQLDNQILESLEFF